MEGFRLNKYVAHSGVCSRRKAADLVKSGKIKVNGEVHDNPAYIVKDSDIVEYNGKELQPVEDYVYFLLNKPENVISTVSDERGRKTVLDIIAKEKVKRIYPVGRLDRNTTGLLLLTNDGDLAKKLTHPSHEVTKVYEVLLERPIEPQDLQRLRNGLDLEDGHIKPDAAHIADYRGENWIQIKLHSGRNRIVRRMVAHLGYEVIKLDLSLIHI